jgi:hypothetical protein
MRNGGGIIIMQKMFFTAIFVTCLNGCGGGCGASIAFGSIAKDTCASKAPDQNQSDIIINSSVTTITAVIVSN